MKISWLVGKYEHSSQLANYAISTTSEREFESGEISGETQCGEPRHFYGPDAIRTASRYHRFGRIVARRKRLKSGWSRWLKSPTKRLKVKKGERGWRRRKRRSGGGGKDGREVSRKKWKAWKWVAKRSAERIFRRKRRDLARISCRGSQRSGGFRLPCFRPPRNRVQVRGKKYRRREPRSTEVGRNARKRSFERQGS